MALPLGGQLAGRGTCHATCSLVGAGGGIGLLVVGHFVGSLGYSINLVVHPLLLALFIHNKDAYLPFGVGLWDIEPSIGDKGGVGAGDSLSYCHDHRTSCPHVPSSSCELGFLL